MPGDKIVLGIGGGIAAYKAPELVRQLTARGKEVIPVLTQAAKQFVTPTSLAAVSGQRVRDDLWDADAELAMGHIELARWADTILIAPATADLIARMAAGIANDLLTTLYLATDAKVVIAPAMNRLMWAHPATARNVKTLRDDDVEILGPDVGDQACGEVGPGRMVEPAEIAAHIDGHRSAEVRSITPGTADASRDLDGLRVVVTAGPTREPIDPVRYITNASSGRQGYAIATAAQRAGAAVTLISGPVALACPIDVTRVDVTTAAQMKEATMALAPSSDVLVAVAAVADYRPAHAAEQKIKKSEQDSTNLAIPMVETDDIVKCVAAMENRPFLVGFAAETHNAAEFARAKRKRKGLDVIVVNDVSDHSIGFDSSDNAVTIIHDEGEETLEKAPKAEIARKLVTAIAKLYAEKRKLAQ